MSALGRWSHSPSSVAPLIGVAVSTEGRALVDAREPLERAEWLRQEAKLSRSCGSQRRTHEMLDGFRKPADRLDASSLGARKGPSGPHTHLFCFFCLPLQLTKGLLG